MAASRDTPTLLDLVEHATVICTSTARDEFATFVGGYGQERAFWPRHRNHVRAYPMNEKKLLIFFPKPVVDMIGITRHSAMPAGTAWGIDAPESNQTCIDGWPDVHIATHYMRGLAAAGASNAPIDRPGIGRFGAL